MTRAEQTWQPAAVHEILDSLPQRVPNATYRLQFHAGFSFADAENIVDYLDALGISDAYASPLFTARPGSTHGYDITDHSQLNPDLGGEQGFERLSAALHRRHMGLLVDIVPNHMGIGDMRNIWWVDVLENGPSSIYAGYFDIDWAPVVSRLRDKVLLPILGDQYGKILERGELRLGYANGAFFLSYWDHSFPVNPRSYSDILSHRLEALIAEQGPDDLDMMELQSIITALKYLPRRSETTPDLVAERNREKEIVKRRLDHLYEASRPVRNAITLTIDEYNGTPGDPRSFDLLDTLIEQQPYRLAFWRVAGEEINYRRFFDVNDLAAIRIELPEVLQATHQLAFRLLAEGKISGLRIDHPDGLWDPLSYFRQLQENYLYYLVADRLSRHEQQHASDPVGEIQRWIARNLDAPGPKKRWPLYVLAEKILAHGESLAHDWAVAGTTGYDFLNEINGVLIDHGSRRALDRIYADVTGPQPTYTNLVNSKKKEILLVSLASELNALSHILDELTEHNRLYRDFTLNSLTFALREVLACLPVYRTYIRGPDSVNANDEQHIEAAVAEAKRRNPRTAESIFDFIRDALLLRNLAGFGDEGRELVLRFVMKFQQLSGPVMAKGVEDTSFYVYNRLIALNEVGGHPDLFGNSVEELHECAAERRRGWPHAMLTTSTHDTKRGEDVRARIAVLSEMPEDWRHAVARWSRLNAAKKTKINSQSYPSRNDEYLLYQTLVGAWPVESFGDASALPGSTSFSLSREALDAFTERIKRYMEKATREAKVHTSWVNPNAAYDRAVQAFVEGILDPRRSKRFLESMGAFVARVASFGRFNSLTQTLVKLTAPGVPDIYQGSELWDLSLVDPDNRRPVDYTLRRRLLAEIKQRHTRAERRNLCAELLECAADGRIKLYITWRALELRREHPRLFAEGSYQPLYARGAHADHIIAFARHHAGSTLIVAAPRLSLRLAGGEQRPPIDDLWGDTWLALPGGRAGARYTNHFSEAGLEAIEYNGEVGIWMRDLMDEFPVALLKQTKEQR